MSFDTVRSGQGMSVIHTLEQIWGTRLSQRELDVARLAIIGLSTMEITERLYISENTVKTHLRNLFRKTRTHGRNELYRRLVEAGLSEGQVDLADSAATTLSDEDHRPHEILVHRHVQQWLEQETPVVVLALDLVLDPHNGSAAYNDSIADLLATSIRTGDHVFKWRESRYLLVLTGSNLDSAQEVGDRLVRHTRRWAAIRGLKLQAAMGLAGTEEGHRDPATLTRVAEERLNAMGSFSEKAVGFRYGDLVHGHGLSNKVIE